MEREELLKGYDDKRALFGLFFAFGNRLQAAGDTFYEEITCKQFFLLICLGLFQKAPPTLKELADVMGSSHQNVKQIVNKLVQNGFVRTFSDEKDKRKIRVMMTGKMEQFAEKYRDQENAFMEKLYEGITGEEVSKTYHTMVRIEQNLIGIKGGTE